MDIALDAPLRFDAKLFAAVSAFRARNDIRYYLNAVCWEPHPAGGALLVATDGHRLAIAFDKEGRVKKRTLTPVSDALVSAARRVGAKVVASVDSRLTCINRDATETFVQPGPRTIEGAFPEIHRVLPDPAKLRQTMTGAFNGRYLAEIGAAAKAMRLGYPFPLRFWQIPAEEGAKVQNSVIARFDNEPNFAVITMPMQIPDVEPPKLYEAYRAQCVAQAGNKIVAKADPAPAEAVPC